MRNIIVFGLCLFLCGCGTMKNKSIAAGGSSDAFKVVSIVDPATGTISPEIIAGGGCFAYCSTKAYKDSEDVPTTIVYSKRTSLWDLFKTGSSNKVFIYVAGSNEKPKDTVEIINKLKELIDK